jgi:hypothetical protein
LNEIEERKLSEFSLMPNELQQVMSLQEFSDLISFLEDCRVVGASPYDNLPPAGFVALFNGRDLSGWQAEGEKGKHWSVRDGILSHDGVAEDLWTTASFSDFSLSIDWRLPGPTTVEDHPVFDSDGNEVRDTQTGKVQTSRMIDAGDSGVFLRGHRKAQANIFCYPVGSGEVWEYRTDLDMPADVRRAVTPRMRADNPVGQWNTMLVTMRGSHLSVELNGQLVIDGARLPGIPERGPIGLQHEFGPLEFKNIFLKELP